MIPRWRDVLWNACMAFAAFGMTALASPALVPNPGFEEGTNGRPVGWHSDAPAAHWSSSAHQGEHGISLQGNGKESSAWQTAPLPLKPGGLYHLSFYARREAQGGCVTSGIDGVNRDFGVSESWQSYGYTFAVPNNAGASWVRLGQWELNGSVFFDDVSLRPVRITHTAWQGSSHLGEGESVSDGIYRFSANFGWAGANYHRPLFVNHCGFNSDRWTFGSSSELIYRHDLPASQTNGSLRLNLNYHVAGTLKVEASRDGVEWLPVGVFDGQRRSGTNSLPASLFPATNIFVRLSSSSNANLQVNTYEYQAGLSGSPVNATGHTHFMEVLYENPEIGVQWESIGGDDEEQISRSMVLSITNVSSRAETAALTFTLDGKPQPGRVEFKLHAPGQDPARLTVTRQLNAHGRHDLAINITDSAGTVLFTGRTELNVSFLADPRAGYWAGDSQGVQLWWCESGWKIGRTKEWPAPTGAPVPITVSAARGEFEPVQLILRPSHPDISLIALNISPLVNSQGQSVVATTRIDQVEYVHVTHPTDSSCAAGWYPDPLPPLHLPLSLTTNQNTVLWITFQVPREVSAGDYSGQIEVQTSQGKTAVPVRLHIYDFAMPKETHLRSALGLGTGEINRFHHLTKEQDRQLVFDKYLTNFAEHRISPYSFFDYAPIGVTFTGDGSNKQAKVDFTKFDQAAARWMDQFNSFLLPLHGMGGGTFQSRSLGTLEGFTEGTPEHARLFKDYLGQVEQHLRERGWLDKAYAYWFDEPDQKDFEFVAAGMQRIRAASPGLKRMLTKQPAPLLEGNVDIWCALTPEWTPEKVAERRAANQEVWWYICCAPTSPYITEFIDHPGSELRLWPWQSWQYGVQGILIWATTYWTSSSAFPGPVPQDPWQDPMSYVSGYDFTAGHIGYWGNGDGRFLYPPHGAKGSTEPCLEGPVNSMRWENLRDGMEDYEYFWLLNQAITNSPNASPELLANARALLKVPTEISADTTHFTTDPRLMVAHRDRVAKMIERLGKEQKGTK